MLDVYGEDSCKKILSTFVCPFNLEIADFIHNKAVEFARRQIAVTFLVFTESEKGNVFAGYYTLANKFVTVSADTLSKTLQKRIEKFTQYDAALDKYLISMPLIAQLGRNYSDSASKYPISGNELLNLSCQNVKKAQHIIGGKMTYIECASNPKLYKFYADHEFISFGKRLKAENELSNSSVLIQMLKYFK